MIDVLDKMDELDGLWEQVSKSCDMAPLFFFAWAVRLSRGPDDEEDGAPLSIVAVDLRANAQLKKIMDFFPKRSARECFSVLIGEIDSDLTALVRREVAFAQIRSLSAQARMDLKDEGGWTKKGRQLAAVSTVSLASDKWWASNAGLQFLLEGASESVPLLLADIGARRYRATRMNPAWEPFERGFDKYQEARAWLETAKKTAPVLAQIMQRHANSVFGEGSVFFAKAGEGHPGNYFSAIAAAFEAREMAEETAIGKTRNPRDGASALVDGVAVKRL